MPEDSMIPIPTSKKINEPKIQDVEEIMTFPEAIKKVIEGKRIARLSWKQVPDHGLLKDGVLMIFTKNAFFNWIVSDGDLLGEDWIVLPDITENEQN